LKTKGKRYTNWYDRSYNHQRVEYSSQARPITVTKEQAAENGGYAEEMNILNIHSAP